jgi:hypothetical protein
MKMKVLLLHALFLCIYFSTIAQPLKQIIRGNVQDKFTKKAIFNANIAIKENTDIIALTNKDGEFSIQVPLGRYTIICNHINYQIFVANNVIVNSGKEVVLAIEMELNPASAIKGVTVKGNRPKEKTINEMSLISARQFSVDEANRYAGSLGDPARMAQNFAGVATNSDRRNDIIIRGNSPLGVSWRAQDIEIPNPNHFSGVGSTGGAISILNNNNLSNSDFLTGAFAPQYGNALAGVFDLHLKNGNNKKREYMAQFGFNGLEFGAEGPFSKKSKASYIINARYSTLELFDALKISLGANALAKYRDLTFKIHVPTKKAGTIDFWGLGGFNRSSSFSKNYDSTGRRLNPRPKGFDTYFDNDMFAIGVNHTYNINENTTSKIVIALTRSGNETHVDSLFNNETQKFNWLDRIYRDHRLSMLYQINKRWNNHHQTQFGANITRMQFDITDSLYFGPTLGFLKLLNFNGNTWLNRGFIQHQYRPNNKLTFIAGVHGMHFALNNSKALEPRLAARWQLHKKLWWNTGIGVHNQLQPLTTYFFNRTGIGSIKDSFTNLNLDFIASNHFISGFDYLPLPQYRVKVEAYYQSITNAAVESTPSSYSTLNEGAYYYTIPKAFSINNGVGYNRGIEATIEKFFSNHFYFLTTGSVFTSRYKGSDNIWRRTAFDGSWTLNGLGGYEFLLNQNNKLSINLKLAALGGRRYTPVDEINSRIAGETRFIEAQAFTLRYPTYFRPDIKISYVMNRKRASHEWGLNIDNFINFSNIQNIEFDKVRNNVGYSYQNGLFPVIQYKVQF